MPITNTIQSNTDKWLLENVQLIDPKTSSLLTNQTVLIVKDLIAQINPVNIPAGIVRVNAKNHLLLPGFIDCHVHGGYNIDLMDLDLKKWLVFSQKLLQEGITGFVFTSVSANEKTLNKIADLMAEFKTMTGQMGARCLGWHMEGPFISPVKKGAHNEHYLVALNALKIQHLITKSHAMLKIITYAPETSNLATLKKLNQKALFSIGHTNADYALTLKHIQQAKIKHCTHLYNAMSNFDHRHPGAVLALWEQPILCELIADGIHVDPAVIKFTYQLKTADNICLITDAMCAKGQPDGRYYLGDLPVEKKDQRVVLENTLTIAGSVAKYNDCVFNFKKFTNCTWLDVIKVSAKNIAQQLKLKVGEIIPDHLADLTLVDPLSMKIKLTIVNGKILYNNLS